MTNFSLSPFDIERWVIPDRLTLADAVQIFRLLTPGPREYNEIKKLIVDRAIELRSTDLLPGEWTTPSRVEQMELRYFVGYLEVWKDGEFLKYLTPGEGVSMRYYDGDGFEIADLEHLEENLVALREKINARHT